MKLRILLPMICAATLLLGISKTGGDSTGFSRYELEMCIQDCFNAYDPTYDIGAVRDCIEGCVEKYGPKPEY